MKKSILTAIIINVFLTTAILAQSPGDTLWTRYYGGTEADGGNSVQPTSDGGYIIAGYTSSYGASYDWDAYLVKTDSEGIMEWDNYFTGNGENDRFYWAEQTTDGGYIISGTTYFPGTGVAKAWLIKTDSNGNMEWENLFGTICGNHAYEVQQTSDGGYVFFGEKTVSGYEAQAWILKTDSSGKMEWEQTFGGSSIDGCTSVPQTSDGGYIMCGERRLGPGTDGDFWLIKTDSEGNMQWDQVFSGSSWEQARSVRQTSDGGYVLVGLTYSFGAYSIDGWLIKTDSEGVMMWDALFAATVLDYFYSVCQTPEAGYIISGITSVSTDWDTWVVKTDNAGNLEWDMIYDYSSGGSCVCLASDKGYIIVGLFGGDVQLLKLAGDDPPPLTPPQNLIYDLISGNVVLNWDAPAGKSTSFEKKTKALLGYNAYHALDPGAFELLGYTTETTYTDVDPIMGLHNYYVTAVYDEGESVSTDTVDVLITGILDNFLNSRIQVFPNPASDLINIKSDLQIETIKVYNYTGQIINSELVNNKLYQVNTSQFNSGIYFFRIDTNEGALHKRIIIE